MAELFWLESPCALFQSTVLIPTCQMSKAAVLNSLTRLLLIAVAVLWLMAHSKLWLTVLVAGLVTIGMLYLFNVKGRQGFREDFHRVYTTATRAPVASGPTIVTSTEVPEDPAPPRKSRVGLVGMETKKIPRTSTVRLDDVVPTVLFRKR
jgi:hypothetical protein